MGGCLGCIWDDGAGPKQVSQLQNETVDWGVPCSFCACAATGTESRAFAWWGLLRSSLSFLSLTGGINGDVEEGARTKSR